MRPPTIVLAFAIAAWFATAAPCRDLYVDNVAGADTRDGLYPKAVGAGSGPYRTIARALRAAHKGDRIIIANTGEPYRESITVQAGRHSGVPGQPFTIVGNGAVLDGARSLPLDVWEHYRDDVFRFRPPRLTYQLIYLDGRPAERQRVEEDDVELPDLPPLSWCLWQRHIYFRTEAGRLPSSYDLSYTALPVGITIYEARHVSISDLVVQGFQLDGVNAHDGVFDARLANLTCRGNGRSGVSIGGASRVRIEACLVGNNGAAQVRVEGLSHTRIINCDLVDDGKVPVIDRQGGEIRIDGK